MVVDFHHLEPMVVQVLGGELPLDPRRVRCIWSNISSEGSRSSTLDECRCAELITELLLIPVHLMMRPLTKFEMPTSGLISLPLLLSFSS